MVRGIEYIPKRRKVKSQRFNTIYFGAKNIFYQYDPYFTITFTLIVLLGVCFPLQETRNTYNYQQTLRI